jgi:hypothetical protein
MDSRARPLYASCPLPDTDATKISSPGEPPRRVPSASRLPRLRSALAGLALAAGSLVLCFGLLEWFAWRAQGDVPERLARSNKLAVSGLDESDPDLFWRYRPHQDLQWKAIRVRTNAFGLRDRERTREKPPGVFRILSLGESTTFGDQIDATQTYSYRLEEILNADATLGRRVEVWNCGICSYTSYQSLRWLERDGLAFQPDLVLFYHEINDFLPTYYRTGDGQALGLGRTDRELGALRQRLGPLMALLEKSHFYRWLRIRVLLAASRALAPVLEPPRPAHTEVGSSPYGPALRLRFPWDAVPIAPGAATDWPDTLPYMANDNALCRVPDPDRLALLNELVTTLRARDVDLVLIHPAYRESRPHRCVLTEFARREGIPIVEFERIVRATGLPKSEAFLDTYHPSARLHELLAEELARTLRPRIPPAA